MVQKMSFEFQDGYHDGHLIYREENVLAILNCCPYAPRKISVQSGKLLKGVKMSGTAVILDIRTERFYAILP